MLIYCVNRVYSGLLCYFKDLVHNIQGLQLDAIQCRVRKVVSCVIQDLNKDIVLFIKMLKVPHHCLFEGVLIFFSL